MFRCEICGKEFTSPNGAKSSKHINSKQHQVALGGKASTPPPREDLRRFFARKLLWDLFYSGPINFDTLELVAPNLLFDQSVLEQELLRLYFDGLVSTTNKLLQEQQVLLEYLKFKGLREFPLDFTLDDMLGIFKQFESKKALVDYFQNFNRQNPGMITITSTQHDYPVDVIIWKKLWRSSDKFIRSGKWEELATRLGC